MLTIATFNLCNLGTDVAPERLARLGHIIAHTLAGPDILALQEIKATTGTQAHGGRVPADATYRLLIEAIMYASGPRYEYREIPPLANRDGGQAGFNIRTGLLFNPTRVVFVDRGLAGPEDCTGIRMAGGHPGLTLNPGRITPYDPAFEGNPQRHWAPSRKALASEFRHGNKRLFIINCHLKSQRALSQRAREYAKKQRHAQAAIIHAFVANLLTAFPEARIVLLGDMNDVTGSKTLDILKGKWLTNLMERLPNQIRYTRRQGLRRQTLDHVLVSPALRSGASIHIPHVNSEDPNPLRASDHDPVLANLRL